MPRSVASLLAIAAGAVTWILLSYLAAVLVMLATYGIPLGAPAWEPTRDEYGLLLLAGLIGGGAGGLVAARFTSAHRAAARLVLPAVMIATVLWGFSEEASTWPGWWSPALAAISAAGSRAGTGLARPVERTRHP